MSFAGDIGKVSLAGDISQVTMSEGLGLLSSPLVLLVYTCKKKTEEAYSDESAGDDDIERLQKELDEDMELESKINDELR
ncbi:unnamed protein product [Brassica napus]|uniref:(rape) hypothetical protein n=1 Tax=Brassica napus TaxID=3708 RepID=A0A816IUJ5_BRANA|nr:unnamed protein product [Brassica napus]